MAKKKSKSKLKIIIIVLISLLIIGLVIFYLIKRKLDWGSTYLNILETSARIDNMNDMKVSLIDIDNNEIPELIITGDNKINHEIEIYSIGNDKKIDTTKIISKDMILEYDYNIKSDKYNWYLNEDENIYSINLDRGKTKKENINYKEDIIKITTNNKMIKYKKNLKDKEVEEIFDKTKKNYKNNKELLSKKAKEKINAARALKNIKKIDASKELVYSYVTKSLNGNTYEYPHINIDSKDVKNINKELDKKYSFISNLNNNDYIEATEVSYKYYINGSILSLVVWNGGNSSITSTIYNINIKTLKRINSDYILKKYKLNKSEVINKSYDKLNSEYNRVINEEKASVNSSSYQEYFNKWPNELKENIKKLNLYINDKNQVILLGEYHHLGGQEYCTQTVQINISDNYNLSELSFENGKTYSEIREEAKQSATGEKKEEVKQNTSTSEEVKTSSSELSKEEIENKLRKLSSEDIFIYEGVVTDNGEKYYIFDEKWPVRDENGVLSNYSSIAKLEVKTDGTKYREIDGPKYNTDGTVEVIGEFRSLN